MKLPALCEKIRRGQVWRHKNTNSLYLVTGGARSRGAGQRAWHCRRYDMKVRVGHAITQGDLWRFFELIGNWNTLPEYVLWKDYHKEGILL